MRWIRFSAGQLEKGAVIIGGTALLFLLASGCLVVIGGPANIFNSTWSVPPVSEVAGYYEAEDQARAGFRLGADGRLEMNSVPAFDGFGKTSGCSYRGIGSWRMDGEGFGVSVDINISQPAPPQPGEPPSCSPMALINLFQLLGHSEPHRLWYIIGDPDEGMGAVFVQKKDR